MDVVWKDTPMDPLDNSTKLSQFACAYASATIDKAVEVKQLVREKEEKIQQLEQQLVEERQSVEHQLKAQMAQLQQSFDKLKLQYQAKTSAKYIQIQQL